MRTRSVFFSIVIALCINMNIVNAQVATGYKNITYQLVPSENKTWGYDIYINGKLFIHQPSVPALPGNAGFTTKTAAEKIAKKVIEKIRKGENPPTISIDELKQLAAIPEK